MTNVNTAIQTAHKFKVSASSLVSKISPLSPSSAALPPRVWYSPIAWHKIQHAISMNTKEVGWFGTVEKVAGGYLITDIFIPKQFVTGTETDILPEALAEIAMEVDDPEQLYYWGHSHVNMGVGPSNQDELQTSEYLNHVDVFIRGIYNKKGECKVDVFDINQKIAYECVRSGPMIPGMSQEELELFDVIMKANVKERVYTAQTYNGYLNPQRSTVTPIAQGNETKLSKRERKKLKNNPRIVQGTNRRSEVNPFVVENMINGGKK